MINRQDHIQLYSGVRVYLAQLIAFVEAAHNELAPDSPLLTQSDYHCWMAEIKSYQQFSCQRCGTFVSAEPFAQGAYMVEEFSRVCGLCYDELTRTSATVQWRLARLAVYAQDHPELCAGLIVELQRRLNLNDWQLECELGLDDIGVARLALCQRPRPGYEATDIATIGAIVGGSAEQLGRLFADEPSAGAEARADERPAQRPFRLDTDEAVPF